MLCAMLTLRQQRRWARVLLHIRLPPPCISPSPPTPAADALQPQGPCLKSLTEEEGVDHLWAGPRAIARRVLRGCVQALAPAAVSKSFASVQTDQELHKAGGQAGRRGAGMLLAVPFPAIAAGPSMQHLTCCLPVPCPAFP